MKIYLDVSCLNRPFDNQSQPRVQLESDAILLIFDRFDTGTWIHVSSRMALIEAAAIDDDDRRRRVLQLLPMDIMNLSREVFDRARKLVEFGMSAADGVHIAAAEELSANVFLTCDDRLLRRCKKIADQLKLSVANPLTWLQEQN